MIGPGWRPRPRGWTSSTPQYKRAPNRYVSAEGKQHLIADLYQKFFQTAFKKQSDALGIVYTPVEVVDFILRAADYVSRETFGRGLTGKDVHILDGFTGTGTFVTRLLQSGLITPADLERKYSKELHANEIMLLAYYIAAVNIETTYHALSGRADDSGDYQPFPGIVLADTFQISEGNDTLDLDIFAANNDRIADQLKIPINVIIGNPPYSVGQTSANDLNANVSYMTLDGKIEATYAKRSTATTRRTLYDSYIRAFRWATDRIGDAGIVAFVSNGGWIDANTTDGIRLSLAEEYSQIYIYNLRGNQRTAGELSRKEGGKIFGGGSRNTVAIFVGVKDPRHAGSCEIRYRDIGDYLTREQKLRIITESQIATSEFQSVTPNAHGDWINQRRDEFELWPPVGDRGRHDSVFATYSLGLATNRDAWVVNYSREALEGNVRRLIRNYVDAQSRFTDYCRDHDIARPNEASVNEFLSANPALSDPRYIKWSVGLKTRFAKGSVPTLEPDAVRLGTYRPFSRQFAYFDASLNERRNQLPAAYPTPHHANLGFYVVGAGSDVPFSALMLDALPNLHVTGAGSGGQFFPRWTYEKARPADGELDFGPSAADVDEWGYQRVDNITDEILVLYRAAVGNQVTKDDIFYYVYGILHDPDYRASYAADLKKMLPHIPTPDSADRYATIAEIGRQLAELHLNYEAAQQHPLDMQLKPGADPNNRETWRVEKMRWRSKTDRDAIIYNGKVTIAGIPAAAHDYMLGSRPALEWIIDRYQVKTDSTSGIVNDPNEWCDEHDDPTYIIDLIKKITTVSVETAALVEQLSQ